MENVFSLWKKARKGAVKNGALLCVSIVVTQTAIPTFVQFTTAGLASHCHHVSGFVALESVMKYDHGYCHYE